MSPERTESYRRVMRTLKDLGPAKLFPEEQERIRFAADTLIFTSDLIDDDAASDALADVGLLCDALIESGRWQPVTADRLAADVAGCGPILEPAELKAA